MIKNLNKAFTPNSLNIIYIKLIVLINKVLFYNILVINTIYLIRKRKFYHFMNNTGKCCDPGSADDFKNINKNNTGEENINLSEESPGIHIPKNKNPADGLVVEQKKDIKFMIGLFNCSFVYTSILFAVVLAMVLNTQQIQLEHRKNIDNLYK